MKINRSISGRPWRGAIGVLAVAVALVLAACGGGNGIGDDEGEEVEAPVAEATGEPSGELTISNWPFYIDEETVSDFEGETGISVDYIEDVDDNATFLGKMQPQLSQGQSGGRDIFVVTDWMAKKMSDLGYLQRFDKEVLEPAYANLVPSLESPSFDPDRDFSLPWQSGMTGLVVNTARAPDITSINDLFDPQYEGQVVFLTEMRDTVPLVMAASGVDPAEATEEDWMAAIEEVDEAAKSGQIRRFAGNGYTRDLANGDAVASIGWSGDAVQLQADNPNIEFVMPDEGCSLWSDNMVIPVGAPNPTAAYEWMNYVYRPENQAQIAEWVNFFSPVQGVREELAEEDPELAESPLIFPDEEFTEGCFTQDAPPAEAEREIEQEFEAVITG